MCSVHIYKTNFIKTQIFLEGFYLIKIMKLFLLTLMLNVLPSSAYAFCFDEAGDRYKVPPILLMAIAKTESNMNPSARVLNDNLTIDIGLMQINSVHLSRLSKYGITEQMLQNNACTNIQVGAWILAQCIADHGYNWRAVGCYNTGSRGSDSNRRVYVQKVKVSLDSLVKQYHDRYN